MSTLKVTNIEGLGSAGFSGTVQGEGTATTNLAQGLIKYWSSTRSNEATWSTWDSFNQSSMTDGGQGTYTSNYTNNFATARHAFSGSCADDTNDAIGPIAVGWRPDVPVNTNNRKWYTVYAGTPYDSHEANVKSAGDLA